MALNSPGRVSARPAGASPDGHEVPSPASDRAPDPADLLEAEVAASAYWRAVAEDRRRQAALVQRRPLVRAAIAVDRRTRPGQDRAVALVDRVRRGGRRLVVTGAGLARQGELAARARTLDDLDDLDDLDGRAGPPPPSDVLVVEVADPVEPSGVNAVVAASTASRIALVGPGFAPLGPRWWAPLVAALDDEVVAATPVVVHPRRPRRAATPHDLLVRWAGLDVVATRNGPVLRGASAGQAPPAVADRHLVTAAAGTCLVVDRRAWDRVGGLVVAGDVDASVVDLSLRLRDAGGRVAAVGASVVLDHRPVTDRSDLLGPFRADGDAWHSVVDAHGAALDRLARPGRRPTITITTAVPSRRLTATWGDWQLATDLAAALERLGYTVRLQTADESESLTGRCSDVHLVLRGMAPVRRTPGQGHVIWVISHPEAIDVAECDAADLVLVASERFAAHLRSLTDTPVAVLLQATDPRRFRPRPTSSEHRHPVAVVANARGVHRRAVADAVAAGLRPAVHGRGWSPWIDPALVVRDHVDAGELPELYASAGVVLNDHWDTMRAWGFLSNRLFDVAACGTPVLSDHLPEVARLFGDLVGTWTDPAELRDLVDALQADPEVAAERAAQARTLVVEDHTFDVRARQLDAHLQRLGLVDGAAR